MAKLKVSEALIVNAGVFNLTDETYWQFDNLAQRTAAEPLDRYSQPGINFGINAKYHF